MSARELLKSETAHITRRQAAPARVAVSHVCTNMQIPATAQLPSTDGAVLSAIAAKLPHPLIPAVSSTGGYVYDLANLAAKCPKGHVHKYPLVDINNGVTLKCKTCNAGKKSIQSARIVVEEALGIPMVAYSNPVIGRTIMRGDAAELADRYEFHNSEIKLMVVFVAAAGCSRVVMPGARCCVLVCYVGQGSNAPHYVRRALHLITDYVGLSAGQRDKLFRLNPQRRIAAIPLPTAADNAELVLENCGWRT